MARLELLYKHVDELRDYDLNPRNNEVAIEAVKNSILNFGFRVPVVVDADNVLVAGHTRVAAVRRIIAQMPERADEFSEVPCFVAGDLSQDQLRAFRLVDNKVSEIATWDFDKLAEEVAGLTDVGIDLTQFGWSTEEIDCLANVVQADCLSAQPQAESADGVEGALRQKRVLGETADGNSIRIAFGSLAFFVLREDFEKWNDALHRESGFNSEAAIDAVASRLGLLEAKARRDLVRGSVVSETEEQHIQA